MYFSFERNEKFTKSFIKCYQMILILVIRFMLLFILLNTFSNSKNSRKQIIMTVQELEYSSREKKI